MIKPKFDIALEVIKKLEKYDKDSTEKLHKRMARISYTHELNNLNQISDLCSKIGFAIPDKEYYVHIELVYSICDALVELSNKHSKILRYFDGFIFDKKVFEDKSLFKKYANFSDPPFIASGMFLNLAARLDSIGLPGETFNALTKSFDPWVNIFNPLTGLGDEKAEKVQLLYSIKLFALNLPQDRNREIFLELPALKFRNSKYIGDIGEEAIDLFMMHVDQAIWGKDATYADILFFCEYAELLKIKNIKSNTLDEIIVKLELQYDIEREKNRESIARMIAYTLAIVTENLYWAATSLIDSEESPDLERDFYSSAFLFRYAPISLSGKPDFTRLKKVISNFLVLGSRSIEDPYLFNLFKRKNSHLFNFCLSACLEEEEYELAIELAVMWKMYSPTFKYDSASYKDFSIILVVPNLKPYEAHTIIYNMGELKVISSKTDIKLSDIFAIKDEIEGTWTYFSGDPEALNLKPPKRQAVEKSNEYLQNLSEYIGLDKIKNVMNENEKPLHFKYLESTWINAPITALLNAETQHTYSVLSNTDNNENQSKIRKVLIWANPDGSLYSSKFEIEAIEYLLTRSNIEFEVVKEDECTKELFMEKYKDTSYDLIWIISHAHLSYDDPSVSEIGIANSSGISLRELRETKIQRETKRYLVLNACQSSAAEVRYNSMNFEGLATSLVNDFQSIIGHLWTADSLAAAVLGAFLVDEFCKGNDLPTSLKLAEISMRKGKKEILKKIEDINPQLDLIERVTNSSKDLSLPFHSMSAIISI